MTGNRPRARLVAFALVLVSLALVTVYFRESSDGALHGTQRIGISVLAPFEIAGERVAQPFQDAYGWSADVLSAKEENKELEKEVRELRQQVIINETAAEENETFRQLLKFRDGPRFPKDYRGVATRVFVEPQTVFRQDVLVAAGSNDGIEVDDSVVLPQGLVGTVTEVAPNESKVRLLTDQRSAASAYVLGTGAGRRRAARHELRFADPRPRAEGRGGQRRRHRRHGGVEHRRASSRSTRATSRSAELQACLSATSTRSRASSARRSSTSRHCTR